MKINSVSNMTFEAKGKFISKEARENAQELLKMMNRDTKCILNPDKKTWHTDILASLSLGNHVKFTDNRLFMKPVLDAEEKKKVADFSVQIGKKWLAINSITGEIINYEIGIFTRLKNIAARAEQYIFELLSGYNKSEIVKKNRFEIEGYTSKGKLNQNNI